MSNLGSRIVRLLHNFPQYLLDLPQCERGEHKQRHAVGYEHGEAPLNVLEGPARFDNVLDHIVGPEVRECMPEPVGLFRQLVHVYE